ncbi:MAG: hypothetical protein K0S61_3943 [Anaerocolumna sp.]|jgi:hypothetical protein|nr:hypothetical protein [Anaerocolumna sp.]
MRIQNFKKKYIIFSLVFIIAGTIISAIGFGTVGFNYNRLKDSTTKDAWYQTVHTNDKNFWYGLELGDDNYAFIIGNSD